MKFTKYILNGLLGLLYPEPKLIELGSDLHAPVVKDETELEVTQVVKGLGLGIKGLGIVRIFGFTVYQGSLGIFQGFLGLAQKQVTSAACYQSVSVIRTQL